MKWETRCLGDVAQLSLGKMLDEKKNRGEPLPYLANINVRWGEFHLDNLREMRFEENEIDRFGLQFGDIVMCEGGEPGRCAIWKDQIPGMMFQKALHRIRPHQCLDSRFLFYAFLHKGERDGFAGLFTGATIKHLPAEKLAKLEVEFPELPLQRRIADVLSAYDDLMENNRHRMALLEESARLFYREWFVRLRFPGHEHARSTNGIPEGWERKTLGEVAELNRASLSGSFDGEIEYVDIASVIPGQITETTPYAFCDAPSRARRIVRHGDIIWSCVRPNRRSHAVIWNPPDNLIVSTGFAVITPNSVPTTFLYFATTSDDFVGYLENHARGAAYPAVVAKDFERAKLRIPSKRLLEDFNDLVEPTFEQTHNLRQQNQKLRAARNLLLPKLMSGELAV
ncbi:MAG: restriction endonuclease subunit S [Terrimicrobiaceae bacterium]